MFAIETTSCVTLCELPRTFIQNYKSLQRDNVKFNPTDS